MLILNGEVLEETINLQVVRVRGGSRNQYVVQHYATEQSMPLVDALSGRQKWLSFVPGDEDQAAMNRCKRYVAKALKKRMLEAKAKAEEVNKVSRTLSSILDGSIPVIQPVPLTPPRRLRTREEVAADLRAGRQCDCADCVDLAMEAEANADR